MKSRKNTGRWREDLGTGRAKIEGVSGNKNTSKTFTKKRDSGEGDGERREKYLEEGTYGESEQA